jgi:hypothetical protein
VRAPESGARVHPGALSQTTQLYIDLAGVTFREEADRLGARVFADVGKSSGKSS